jgi:hypothetical protein
MSRGSNDFGRILRLFWSSTVCIAVTSGLTGWIAKTGVELTKDLRHKLDERSNRNEEIAL